MNKKEIIFLVEDYSSSKVDWKKYAYEEGAKLGITIEYKDGGMVDEEIGFLFEELLDIGLEDEVEGYMICSDNDVTSDDMVKKLTELGFDAKIA